MDRATQSRRRPRFDPNSPTQKRPSAEIEHDSGAGHAEAISDRAPGSITGGTRWPSRGCYGTANRKYRRDGLVPTRSHPASRFPAARGPGSDDICYATTNRQRSVRAIAADADVVLVVGSANSSNSLRLVETAQRAGTTAYLVDSAEDVELGWLAGAATVGITAGASAPPAMVGQIVTALSGLGSIETKEIVVTTEAVQFGLPRELRQSPG